MRKVLVFFIFICIIYSYCFSQAANNVTITVEITSVVINGGKVYLAIFSNAEEFRKEEPYIAFALDSRNTVLSQEVTLPAGEYVVSAFQDANNNGICDFNLLGIPRELVGISNYNGRGFPTRNFDRQKIRIDSSTSRVTIGLYKF